jgi:hypothetical protein
MLAVLFSAKGSPGVTSAALVLAAAWPRPVVLLEADPSGGDLAYRCRSASGGPLSTSPSILGFVSAARKDRVTSLRGWTQRLGCGVDVVPGINVPSQARGMADLWAPLTSAARSSDIDVIVDVGRLGRDSPTAALVDVADVQGAVLTPTLDSVMHTRELLKDIGPSAGGHTVPLVVGRARTASADRQDVDEVMGQEGLILDRSAHLPLDHPGLSALENGASSTGRVRTSHVVRAARAFAQGLLDHAGEEVAR